MFLESASKAGWIEVICGSMFSGKTEELIRAPETGAICTTAGGNFQAEN